MIFVILKTALGCKSGGYFHIYVLFKLKRGPASFFFKYFVFKRSGGFKLEKASFLADILLNIPVH